MTRATVGFLDARGNFVPVKASRPLPTTGGGGGGGGGITEVNGQTGPVVDIDINDLGLTGTSGQVIKHNGTEWVAGTDANLIPPNLTQVQVENEASTVFGLVSGQRLSQAINTNDALVALTARVLALEGLMETAIQGDGTITDLVAKTQAQYDAITTKDPTTQYTIKAA